ncbi:protein kinase, putative [Eimeria mitis]|uniref:Protein kinase, putative n=1 Tax=Eimeria mitis TaxID=44415 RepID=U6K1L1_9EIME|nr:protein kinase, putative [Eimeria mitis]CDJ30207.1 protein kinase, putative [Eimeria mitis]
MAPLAFGEWAPPVSGSTSAVPNLWEGSSLNMQCTSQPTATAPSCVFESAESADASERQLHIFRIDGDGRPRMTYRNAGGNGKVLSTSTRRAGKQTSASSPSKFELAAVAALCSPAARAPPQRSKAPKPLLFPSAHSFVPGRQLPLGSASSVVAGREPESACSIPPATIHRHDRGAKGESPVEALTSFTGSSFQSQTRPSALHWEGGAQQSQGSCLGMGPLQQSLGGLGGSLLRCVSPNTNWASASQRQNQQPDCIPSANSLRSPYGSLPRHLKAVPAQNAGPTSCSFIQPSSDFSPAETSFCGGSAMQPPTGLKAPNSTVQQPGFADGYTCRSILPRVKPGQTTIQKSVEEAQEFSDVQRPEVVTVYGTDRFWDLMETLAELQRGPTSLLSSSVTFDSVLLPGGELQYSVIEEGSFGKVFVGTHRGAKVAIKVPVESMLSTDPAGVVERTLNEWEILTMCQHPNVVRLVGGIVHGPFDVWLVTELVNGSDLHSRKYSRDPLVRRFISPQNGLYMCRQLAAVVAYLHIPVPGRKPVVVHRDIKPENVLISDDWTIQLCDFGDAEASPDGRVSRISGATWFYAPAELLRCSPVECLASNSGVQLPPFNEKWDIWSMGCVFQEMFGFFNPMHVHISSRDSPSVIYEKLKAKAIAGTLVPHIAEEIQGIARNIILSCLNPDPSARPSAMEVLNMWNARDEDILKDIHTRPIPPQANIVDSSSFNSVNRRHFPGSISEPQELLPNVSSVLTDTSGSTKGDMGNALYGHNCSSASAQASTGSTGSLVLENGEPASYMVSARALTAKEGARFVQSQGLPAAAGWQ